MSNFIAARHSLNLTVLQRIDVAIEDELTSVAHVAIYEFLQDQQTWVHKMNLIQHNKIRKRRKSKDLYL